MRTSIARTSIKTARAALAVAVVLAAERPCPALTSLDLTDNGWSASYSSSLRVQGLGRSTDSTSGDATFSSDQTFSAQEDDNGTLRTYTGTWRLTNKGRRLRCRLDTAGRAELQDVLFDWISEMANDGGGPPLTNLRVRLVRANFTAAPVPTTLSPFTIRLAATGNGSGRLGQRHVSGAAVYSARIRLTPR